MVIDALYAWSCRAMWTGLRGTARVSARGAGVLARVPGVLQTVLHGQTSVARSRSYALRWSP